MKKFRKITKIFGFIFIIIYLALIILTINLNVLPPKYLIPLIIGSLIITILLSILLIKKNIKKKIKITSFIISLILTIIYIFIGYYMYHTINFMDNVKKIDKETEIFYVLANKKSNCNKLKDIKGKIYVLNNNDKTYKKAMNKLSKKTNKKYKKENSTDNLITKINDNKTIFISKSLYELLSDKKTKLDKKTKIIYKIKVSKNTDKITKKVDVFDDTFNIYISGIDTSGSISNVARSDVNMVVTVNPKTHKILLTSIPRDYYVKLHTSGSYDKLTHSGIYGINESIWTIEDLLDIDINYYFRVNFTTVINIVDVIGGITVYSDYNFITHGMGVKYNFVKGENYLNGQKALAFSRERKSFSDGDRQRIKNQQIVLTAIINKLISSETLITKYSSILNEISKSFQTNLDKKDMSKLIKKQINDMPKWDIESISLTGKDSHNTTYTYGSQNLYVMSPDTNSIEEAKNKINLLKND